MNADEDQYYYDNGETTDRAPLYAPMSVSKFVVLYMVSFGLYGLVWQYRNWRYVKARDNSDIWPLARVIFIAPIWFYTLLIDIREEEGASLSGWLAAAYFILWGAGARLSFMFGIISLLSFLPLLPALHFINRINREDQTELPPYFSWRGRDALVFLAGSVFVAMTVFDAIAPSTRVLAGSEVLRWHTAFLLDVGLVNTPDDVLFFYSPGFASIRGEGTVLTSRGIGTYWTDPVNGERLQIVATCENIQDIVPTWSEQWYDQTEVRIDLEYGGTIWFVLSNEAGGDREFIAELRRRCG